MPPVAKPSATRHDAGAGLPACRAAGSPEPSSRFDANRGPRRRLRRTRRALALAVLLAAAWGGCAGDPHDAASTETPGPAAPQSTGSAPSARAPETPGLAVDLPPRFRGLAIRDETRRFSAALDLIAADPPALDADLEIIQASIAGAGFPEVDAAVEFVRRRRQWRATGESAHLETDKKPGSAAASAPPPVILISVDTLRADRLSCYGYRRPTTPAMDAVAARGIRFDRAYTPAPWTLPAHMSMMTSLYPSFHKLEHGGRQGSVRLDDGETTLAEILSAAGYSTAALVAHPYLAADWGFDRGFDLYRRAQADVETQVDTALAWLDWHRLHVARGLAPGPFFLFLHVIDPHEPYDPPGPFQQRFAGGYDGALTPADSLVTHFRTQGYDDADGLAYVASLYDADVAWVDASLARLFRAVETGEPHAALLLTSDHGEAFGEHDSMGHKQTLYDEVLRVPLLLAAPGRVPAGRVVDVPVSVLDVFPTVLELAGLDVPAGGQGVSLLAHLASDPAETPAADRALYAEFGPLGHAWQYRYWLRSIRAGRWKLIQRHHDDGRIDRELYDLRSDPEERNDLWPEQHDAAEVAGLERRLAAFVRDGTRYNAGFRDRQGLPLSPEMTDSLRALGYID